MIGWIKYIVIIYEHILISIKKLGNLIKISRDLNKHQMGMREGNGNNHEIDLRVDLDA